MNTSLRCRSDTKINFRRHKKEERKQSRHFMTLLKGKECHDASMETDTNKEKAYCTSAQSDVEWQTNEAIASAIVFAGVSLFSAHSDVIQPMEVAV